MILTVVLWLQKIKMCPFSSEEDLCLRINMLNNTRNNECNCGSISVTESTVQ